MLQGSSSRRRFLQVLAQGSALAGAACLGAGCTAAAPSGMIPAGNVSALAVGSLNVVSGNALAVGRDAGGVYAMTLICTHQGCDIATSAGGSVTPQMLLCGCHGSEYDGNGAVLRGPATAPLQHFAVTIDSTGAITVNADQTVAATVRTPVGSG
jgi:nitrite reductase/ring-hydroxylating ferredoxin subunit